MHRQPLSPGTDLVIVQGDLTALQVDAIVNAAAPALLGGGGVDGAIHRAAGPQLREACRALPELRPRVRCETGQARLTRGFGLAARFVIHTVGPVYTRHPDPAGALSACHRASLKLARTQGCRTIAFPAISCGAYGYPLAEAAPIALEAVRDYGHGLREIWFALFTDQAHAAFLAAAERLA